MELYTWIGLNAVYIVSISLAVITVIIINNPSAIIPIKFVEFPFWREKFIPTKLNWNWSCGNWNCYICFIGLFISWMSWNQTNFILDFRIQLFDSAIKICLLISAISANSLILPEIIQSIKSNWRHSVYLLNWIETGLD